MKVLCVIGTRPEAIKMAPVVKALRKRKEQVEAVVCVTGQHREMLDRALEVFGITADYDLDVMREDQGLSDLTATLILGIDRVVADVCPNWVLIQGDTTSAAAGALVGVYRKIWVAHVEAGLRTGRKSNPFPEEMNRRIVDVLSDLYFAPTEDARSNLLEEGVNNARILVTGNTVVDALQEVGDRPCVVDIRVALGIPPAKRVVVVTTHRRESFGKPLENICLAIKELAEQFDDIQVVFPVHANPNVRQVVNSVLNNSTRVTLTEPIGYFDFLCLLKETYVLLTDSGGLQEEAPSFRVPVLVLRDMTERPEAVRAGTARLVGTRKGDIVSEARRLLVDTNAHHSMISTRNPFGDGKASERIVDALLRFPVEQR
jgi:UDP-N-acetylglucosamine 2-epimerase